LEGEEESLAAGAHDYLFGADCSAQLAGVEFGYSPAKLGDTDCWKVAAAVRVFGQGSEDFRVGGKAGLAESEVIDPFAGSPHLPHAFIDVKRGRLTQLTV